ncbi:NADP oxidoreductase [Nocardia sp. SYP-A9097]|uniref:NADPH-dependent F420 reductase n=1 Tax=Nocardia sp. SYP-A9097 TaxID=2663237 RepID=UPI00129A267B|nr:NAD(P)-binding domain-containing protein [Nocardia sp. SYP-A9097]MRH87150.1 NADP oxidoreductase [Nocardia sp. SYP-A9097]
MRIGIIGAGAMARALGGAWAAAGHDIVVGARDTTRATETATAIGPKARAAGIAEAAEFGEAVLPALPVAALTEVLALVGPALTGRTLIDCTNAFLPDSGKFVLSEDAVAERIAATVPGAHVVKAFNLCAAEVWESERREFEGRTLLVPLCGDDAGAIARVSALVSDMKLKPFHAGGLAQARYLEATSAFVVGQWFGGNDSRAMFPPMEATFADADE